MKQTKINLSEAQLAGIFQTQSKLYSASSHADDCLGSCAASDQRLNHVEDMVNDYSSAQALKASFSLKEWSQVVGESIENSQRSWFNVLGMSSPFKTTMATAAFAVAFAFALPVITQFSTQPQSHIAVTQDIVHNDMINSIPFESDNDQLSKGGFDKPRQSGDDSLFNASFG